MVKISQTIGRTLLVTSALGLGLNIWLGNKFIGLTALIIWLMLCAFTVAKKILGAVDAPRVLLGITGTVASIGFLGSLLYQIKDLSNVPILLLLGIVTCLAYRYVPDITLTRPKLINKISALFIAGYFVVTAGAFTQLFRHQSAEAMRSTWEVLPVSFWILAIISTALFVTLFITKQAFFPALILQSVLFYSTALIIYKVGYGYDPFIHLATLKYIAANGFITPKKLYYIGLYAPLIFFFKISALPLQWLNASFVPLLASLSSAAGVYIFTRTKNLIHLAPAVLALPFSAFIMTTPQNLGNSFLLVAALLALTDTWYWRYIWLLALAALVTQPLAGIPLLALACFVTAQHVSKTRLRILWRALGGMAGFFGLIGAFYALALSTNFKPNFALESIQLKVLLPFTVSLKITAQPYLDIIYLYSSLLVFVLIFLAWLGSRYAKRYAISPVPLLFTIGTLIFNSLIFSSLINFPFLINYERLDFAKRLIEMSTFLALPLALIGLSKIRLPIALAAGILTIALMSSYYLSYPREDNYFKTPGYTISEHDLAAVKQIEANAQGQPYIVLANQNLGAAALNTFGFINHRLGPDSQEQYFYSIPTGGWLYKYFYNIAELKQSVMPNVTAAGQDYNTKLVYLAINNYWWTAKNIAQETADQADEIISINNGKLIVYRFNLK